MIELRHSPWLLPLLLGGCVGLPPAAPIEDSGTTWATTGVSGTTGSSTAISSSASSGDTSDGSTTASATTVDPDSTSSAGSSEGSSTGAPVECNNRDDCGSNEVCSEDGLCASQCGAGWGVGTYDSCLNEYGARDLATQCGGEPPAIDCAAYGDPFFATSCSTQGCASACDCPAPPPTGNATVTCGNIALGDQSDCYLSCADGEACPDGMICHDGIHCVTEVADLPMYGNCGAVAAGCADGSVCIIINGAFSMCVASCNNLGDCDPAPVGSAEPAVCDLAIAPPDGPECVIPCNNDSDCPFSMACVNDDFCAWPL